VDDHGDSPLGVDLGEREDLDLERRFVIRARDALPKEAQPIAVRREQGSLDARSFPGDEAAVREGELAAAWSRMPRRRSS